MSNHRKYGGLRLAALSGVALSALAVTHSGMAQEYPNRPIRIITTPVASGGDVVSRELSAGMNGPLGQPIVVENRAALNAIEFVSKAAPDGYTLLVNGSVIWLQPLLRKSTPWDPVRDFAPISLLARSPNVLVVTPSIGVNNVRELLDLARAKPGALSYFSAGPGSTSQLASELFKSMGGGLNIVGVAYKGTSQGMIDLLEGRIHMGFVVGASVAGQVKSGKLKALGVTSRQATALAEGLPTISDSGLPGYESVLLIGAFAPAKTSPTVINRLNREMLKVLNEPAARQKLFNAGADVVASTPEELLAAGKADMARWGKVITEANLQAE